MSVQRTSQNEEVPPLRLVRGAMPAPMAEPHPCVAGYRLVAEKLVGQLGDSPSVLALNRCLLFLTQKYREARRLAPADHSALETIWDAACQRVEDLSFVVDPPPLDLPQRSRRRKEKPAPSPQPAGTWFATEGE